MAFCSKVCVHFRSCSDFWFAFLQLTSLNGDRCYLGVVFADFCLQMVVGSSHNFGSIVNFPNSSNFVYFAQRRTLLIGISVGVTQREDRYSILTMFNLIFLALHSETLASLCNLVIFWFSVRMRPFLVKVIQLCITFGVNFVSRVTKLVSDLTSLLLLRLRTF